jgi:hypothetical protein
VGLLHELVTPHLDLLKVVGTSLGHHRVLGKSLAHGRRNARFSCLSRSRCGGSNGLVGAQGHFLHLGSHSRDHCNLATQSGSTA